MSDTISLNVGGKFDSIRFRITDNGRTDVYYNCVIKKIDAKGITISAELVEKYDKEWIPFSKNYAKGNKKITAVLKQGNENIRFLKENGSWYL